MIEINGLRKAFGALTVLEDINLEIQDGEIYGLVGRSGAGKSTLLRCINGLESYDDGSLKVDGQEVKDQNKKEIRSFRKDMGMIFQHFSLLERRTVYENVALPLKCWKYDQKTKDKRVKELLELVGISDKIHERPRVLSGGQKQRVAIARALTMEPKFLLCDEATSALDPKTTRSILQLLRRINEELHLTIIVVTHQMSVVREVCQRISILEQGKIAATGPVEDIFLQQPPALQNLLGEEELLLPKTGVNVKILLPSNISGTPVITSLARELNSDFPIVGGKMERYRDTILGSFIINLSEDAFSRLPEILAKRNIPWERLESTTKFCGNQSQQEV